MCIPFWGLEGVNTAVWGGREEQHVDLEPGRVQGGQHEDTWVWAGGRYEEGSSRAGLGAPGAPLPALLTGPDFPA